MSENSSHSNDNKDSEGDSYYSDNDTASQDDTGNTMMSIFASYYGIEDDNNKSKLNIDSPQFDAKDYVQVRTIFVSY